MLLNRIAHFLAKLSLGKEVATSLLLLRLILDALDNRKVDNVARFVYGKLPVDFKAPKGPATEAEFVEVVQIGQLFLSKIKAVLNA